MTAESQASTGKAQHVHEAIAAYLQAIDAGRTPDRQQFLAKHADLAAELEAFLSNHDQVARLAEPLRPTLADEDPTLGPRGLDGPAPGATVRYFGDYEVLEELARGGMGVVFKARQVSLNRIVALKMI